MAPMLDRSFGPDASTVALWIEGAFLITSLRPGNDPGTAGPRFPGSSIAREKRNCRLPLGRRLPWPRALVCGGPSPAAKMMEYRFAPGPTPSAPIETILFAESGRNASRPAAPRRATIGWPPAAGPPWKRPRKFDRRPEGQTRKRAVGGREM